MIDDYSFTLLKIEIAGVSFALAEQSESFEEMVKPSGKINSYYYSEKSPQFFKIFLPDHCSQQLPYVIPYKSILRIPVRRSWPVDVKKAEDHFVFEKGWPKFVEDNSLKFEDFIIFSYDGNSEFHVTVFGQNNCPKGVDITAMDSGNEPQPLLRGNQIVEACEFLLRGMSKVTQHPRGQPATQENVGSSDDSRKFISKHPVFQIVLAAAYIQSGFLHISSYFWHRCMEKPRASAKLEYSNKWWPVKLTHGCSKHHFGAGWFTGWFKFIRENTLQLGDIRYFELIEKENYVFKVSVRRGVNDWDSH